MALAIGHAGYNAVYVPESPCLSMSANQQHILIFYNDLDPKN